MSDNYDCIACPAYCCAYPIIQATGKDIRRLAKHLRKTEEETRSSFTVLENSRLRCLKLTPDKHLATKSCVFLDKDTRGCTVYEGRPEICRDHPGERCEWHDRRMIEQAIANQGKKKKRTVVMLKAMPWTIDAEHPLYDEEHVSHLLECYATGDGLEPGPSSTKKS